MKLEPWPNKLGYSWGAWEFMLSGDGPWVAVKKPDAYGFVTHIGYGNTPEDAKKNATPTEEYKNFRRKLQERRRES